jgi:hypothetical protein
MNKVVKFIHELMNPHCLHCKQERMQQLEQDEINREITLEQQRCKSCEYLQMELARLHQLLDKLTNTKEETIPVQTGPQKIVNTTSYVPFNVKRQQLELASKIKAAELRQASLSNQNAAKPDNNINEVTKITPKLEKEIDKLEESLGINPSELNDASNQ